MNEVDSNLEFLRWVNFDSKIGSVLWHDADEILGFEGRHKVDEMFEAKLPAITIEVNFEGAEGSEDLVSDSEPFEMKFWRDLEGIDAFNREDWLK